MRRSAGILLLFLLCILLLPGAGCGRLSKKSGVEKGRPVTIGVYGQPECLNPHLARSLSAREAFSILFRSFTIWDDKWQLRPVMAKVLPSLDNGMIRKKDGRRLEIEYDIREDARWSDGTPVVAGDFIFSYQMASFSLLKRLQGDWVDHLSSLVSPAKKRLMVRWNDLSRGADLPFYPLPSHLLEADMMKTPSRFFHSSFNIRPVGNGPYKIRSVRTGRNDVIKSLELQPNEHYALKKPSIGKVIFRFFGTREGFESDLFEGNFDVVPHLSIEDAVRLSGDVRFRIWFGEGTRLVALNFDTRNSYLSSRRIREALTLGLDRRAIVDALYGERGRIAGSWIPCRHPAYVPLLWDLRYDPEKARAILNEEGWREKDGVLFRDGKPFTLILIATKGEGTARTGGMVKEFWKHLGIDVSLEERTEEELRSLFREGGYPGAIVYTYDVLPPLRPISLFGARFIPEPGNKGRGLNLSRWQNPRNEKICIALFQGLPKQKEFELLREHQDLVLQELPMLPLFFHLESCAFRKDLCNFMPRGFWEVTWNIEEWYWKK